MVSISSGDLVYRYSVKTGSAGDSTGGTAAGSLGKYCSTTAVASGAGGLFDDISGPSNASSEVDYRAMALLNNHGSLTLTDSAAYLSAEVSGGASIALAVDNIAASAKGASAAQMAEIANETTAPTGVGSFSSPTTRAGGISIGNVAAGFVRGLWVRRTAAASAALDNDGCTFAWAGDSSA